LRPTRRRPPSARPDAAPGSPSIACATTRAR
jgi:hypothetical protein